MKYMFVILLALLMSVSTSAGAFNVISANGFSCSTSGEFVTCEGRFPGMTGNVWALGRSVVTVGYDKDGVRYSYASDNGCLLIRTKNSWAAINVNGKKKMTTSAENAVYYCDNSR